MLRRLRLRRKPLPVMILTAHGAVEERVRGLNLGADDYLTKPFDLTEVEARARALIRRSHGHERTQLQCGPLHYDGTSGGFTLRGDPLALTGRERAVLEVLMLRDGRAANKAAISEKIFGINESVNADAIEIYVHRLRKKLDGSGVAIVMLRGLGYLLEAVPQAPAAIR
ncbi:Transcriptional regulatory protein tctD [Ralstonia syzygii subsp. syzygii]|nr:Transcriptional regulatory protein tctD [Ralstonia syzygii subsp. syzygii]